CSGGVVARGHETPEPGRLSIGQVDPGGGSPQSQWSGRGRHPAYAAVEALLDPYKVLTKSRIGGLLDVDAADRLRLGEGIADPGPVFDLRAPLGRGPEGLGIGVENLLWRAGILPARDRGAARALGRNDGPS